MNDEFVRLLESQGQLVSLRNGDDTYYLTLLDSLELRNELEREYNELQSKSLQGEEQTKKEEKLFVLKNRFDELDVAIKKHMKSLKSEKEVYEGLSGVLQKFSEDFDKASPEVRTATIEGEFGKLRRKLDKVKSSFSGLTVEQNNYFTKVIDSITDLETLRQVVSGIGNEADTASLKFAQAVARMNKFKIDKARKEKKDDETVRPRPTKGKSEAQRLLEARLRIIEKIARAERDINASSVEDARNKLQDKIDDLKKHFDKELKLYRNNARKKKQILQVQSALERKLLDNAFSEEMIALTQLGNKFKQNATNEKTERAKIVSEQQKQKQELYEQFQSLKNIAGIEEHINKLRKKHKKKSAQKRDSIVDFTLSQTADNAKMLGTLFDELESDSRS
jgi:hypothetical protein